MLWWILLLAMQCQWAEMGSDITHKGQDFPPLYRFDCCQFPNAVSCRHCITPTEDMNSWKIPSYVFNPGSGFSNVSACLLSIWWNHVHRRSHIRRNKYNNWCKASKLIAPALTTIWSQIFKMGPWKNPAMHNCLLLVFYYFHNYYFNQ